MTWITLLPPPLTVTQYRVLGKTLACRGRGGYLYGGRNRRVGAPLAARREAGKRGPVLPRAAEGRQGQARTEYAWRPVLKEDRASIGSSRTGVELLDKRVGQDSGLFQPGQVFNPSNLAFPRLEAPSIRAGRGDAS